MMKNKSKNKINKVSEMGTGLASKAKKGQVEFLDFLKGYNVIGMSVGVVIGNAVKDLVSSIASNLIMPLVGMVTPSGSYKDIALTIGETQFKVGAFLGSLLDFLIIALVVFVVVKKILKIEVGK